ncbi:MAG: OmpA family protein [Methylococcales bacterium]|nr:OmpA family protein [Methylococcales bacterium]
MKKSLLFTAVVATAVMSGCATQPRGNFDAFQAKDLNPLVQSKELQQKTNNFFVINDSSGSMTEPYINSGLVANPTTIKLEIEKELLSRMNKTIPNIPLNSGLRSFGFGKCVGLNTKLNQASESYSKSAFNAAIDSLACASGGSPMPTSIALAEQDLSSNSGTTALIILSDGFELDSSPYAAAKALKARYGDKLCIYTVWVGNPRDDEGRRTLLNLSNIGSCGFSTAVTDIASSAGMGNFVEKVFFKRGAPAPISEGDADKDGVLDSKDKCPGTPIGAKVNALGCWVLEGVNFDTNKSNIKSRYYSLLNEAAVVLKRNPGLTIEVQGHTDSVGSDQYNARLSERRANSVKNYLRKQANGNASLKSRGYGEVNPIASNATSEGRAQNRRVQLDVIKR